MGTLTAAEWRQMIESGRNGNLTEDEWLSMVGRKAPTQKELSPFVKKPESGLRLASAEPATTFAKAGVTGVPSRAGAILAGGLEGLTLGYLPDKFTQAEREAFPTAFKVSRFAGEAVPLLRVARGVQVGGKLLGQAIPTAGKILGKRIPSAVATGGGFGLARKPEENESRLTNSLIDAVAFGAFDTVLAGLGKFVAKPVIARVRTLIQEKKTAQAAKELQNAGIEADQLESIVNEVKPKIYPGTAKGAIPRSLTLKTPIGATIPKIFGQSNKLFTANRKGEALKRLESRTTQLQAGIDPTVLRDWVEIGGYYVEGGAREFGEWSARMVAELGDQIKPHLRKIYEEVNTAVKPLIEKQALPEGTNVGVNPKRFAVGDQTRKELESIIESVRPELEKRAGHPLTHSEVIDAAEASDILRQSVTREKTAEIEASILRTAQNISAAAQGKGMSAEFLWDIQNLGSYATFAGRLLESHKIPAVAQEAAPKIAMAKKLLQLGVDANKLIEASKGVDFTNAKEAALFYRKFIKPTFGEKLNEFRYINLLSSPLTHIVNAFSNLLQTAVVRPATRLTSGVIDNIASTMGKREQTAYLAQVPAYYRGAFNSFGEATKKFLQAMRGETRIARPDVMTGQIPTYGKILSKGYAVPRAMEAADVFFRTLVEGGEREALALGVKKAGQQIIPEILAELEAQAKQTAARTVFREPLDPTNKSGQGAILSFVDKMTQAVLQMRRGEKNPIGWFIPFVQTPMSIFKQGIEYSPLGYATIAGAKNKTEQLSKALIGSAVFGGSAWLALNGKATWSIPRNPKEKELFYAAGMKPFSVKIGNKWIGYSRLGPLAYPLAMGAAVAYYWKEDPKAQTEETMEKLGKTIGGIGQFFSNQSYMEGIRDILDVTQNVPGALPQALTSAGQQTIPLSSLQRWTAHLIDPVYRKTEKGLSVEAIVNNLKKDLPFLSKQVEPWQTPSGRESRRDLPLVGALSPVGISVEKPEYAFRLKRLREQKRREFLLRPAS